MPDKFEAVEEQKILTSLINSVHDGSHDIADELHVSDYDEMDQRYKIVFRTIFDANGQLGHYNHIMKIDGSAINEIYENVFHPSNRVIYSWLQVFPGSSG